MQRYPDNIQISIEDFRRSAWRAAVDAPRKYGHDYSLWQSFSELAQKTVAEGDAAAGKVLWLLADACSMKLNPASQNEPFRPMCSIVNGRSALPEDFHDGALDLFEEISNEATDIWLRARLGDLLWVRRRDYQSAILAVDSYRSMPLDADTWLDARECWARCLHLTVTLRAGAGERLTETENALVASFRAAERKDIILALGVSELLLTYGLAVSQAAEFGGRLEAWARLLSDEGKHDHARQYFDAAINWFETAKDTRKVWDLTADIAKGFFDQAKAHKSQALAVDFYERALQTYRQIPKAERERLGVEERLEALRVEITTAGKNALGEMKRISVGTDISDLMERARNEVKGKSPLEALHAFANIHSGAKAAMLRERCIKKVTDFPFSTMFGRTHFSLDGRVVGKRSAITSGEPDAERRCGPRW